MSYNQMAWPMVEAHPWLGYGPGAFATAFQTYATGPVRAAQLHNDWLETLITFGAAGSALVALAAGAMFTRRFCAGGIHASWRFTLLLWVSLGGCLTHALFDFPLQIYSVLWLFLLVCAVLSVLGERVVETEAEAS
jgi:O-antigen ligase